MSVKDLTKITLTDLWREFNSIEGGFWEKQEDAVKEFKKTFIEGSLQAERDMLIGSKAYERQNGRKDYRICSAKSLERTMGKEPLKFTQKS